MENLSNSQLVEVYRQQLEIEKNQALLEFTESLENSKNRAIARMVETCDKIIEHFIEESQAKSSYKKKPFVLDLDKVATIYRPEALCGYEWEATVTFPATRIYRYRDANAEDGTRTELVSSYLTRHGETKAEALASLQLAFQEIMDAITV